MTPNKMALGNWWETAGGRTKACVTRCNVVPSVARPDGGIPAHRTRASKTGQLAWRAL
jgi:hypothetical protein